MNNMVSNMSNGKRSSLQMTLVIKGVVKKKYIRIRHSEKRNEELHLKFGSKNHINLDTEFYFFFSDLSLLLIHCCQLVKHQAVSNIISHYSSINVVVICTICHTNVIGQRKHFLRSMLKCYRESDRWFLWQKSGKSMILLQTKQRKETEELNIILLLCLERPSATALFLTFILSQKDDT